MDVSRETRLKLALLSELVRAENHAQNLIAPSTVAEIETRHIADSVQLLDHLPDGVLVDIGTGAGFPGLVLACCRASPIHLVEPRGKRAAFLRDAVTRLGLSAWTTVWPCKVEQLDLPPVEAITARAVAPLTALFAAGIGVSAPHTRWVLPKGRGAQTELETARLSWQGEFGLHPSRTDPEARIVIATNVRRRR